MSSRHGPDRDPVGLTHLTTDATERDYKLIAQSDGSLKLSVRCKEAFPNIIQYCFDVDQGLPQHFDSWYRSSHCCRPPPPSASAAASERHTRSAASLF